MSGTDQQSLCIALGIVFLILPIIAVVLRVLARMLHKTNQQKTILQKPSLHADDYLIFAAMLFAQGTGAAMLYSAFHGNLGHRLTYTVSPTIPDQLDALVIFLKSEYIFSLFAQLSILSAKLSLLALYRRIFITRTFRLVVLVVGAIVVVWHTVFILLFIMRCLPVAAIWNFALASHATCLNELALWEAYAVSDVLTDTLVLSLPAPAIMSLQMSNRQKFAAIMIFLLGAIVIGTGITRTVFFFIIAKESLAQITYDSAPCLYWSFIETSLAVVGACLPTLGPLFKSKGKRDTPSLYSRLRGLLSLRSRATNGTSASGSHSRGSEQANSDFAETDSQRLDSLDKHQVYVSRTYDVESSKNAQY